MLISIKTILRGIGQIMLQENAMTGLLFLIGIFWGSTNMGIATLLSVITATLTAKLFKWNEDEIQQGLYGFSAALVGVAMVLFFEVTWLTWLGIIIGSIIAAWIQYIFIRKKIPVYTLPFILVTWVLIFIFRKIIPIDAASSAISPIVENFAFIFRGYGQVIFQDNYMIGILFFIGVLIHSPLAALFGLMGAVFASLFAYFLNLPMSEIEMGLHSYNAVLCAIALTGQSKKDILYITIAVIASVWIGQLMNFFHFIPLTFPFVAATWASLIIKKMFSSIQ